MPVSEKYDICQKRHELAESIDRFLQAPDTLKGLKIAIADALANAQTNFEYWLETDTPSNLAGYIQQMAEDAIKAILSGDEEGMRRYLGCQRGGYTGRDRDHSVIHGKLFETGAIGLRKQIVDAFPELLKDERILDLEDQVKSLVLQVNKANQEKDAMWQRVIDHER